MPKKQLLIFVPSLLAVTVLGCSSPDADPTPADRPASPSSTATDVPPPADRPAPPSSAATDVPPPADRPVPPSRRAADVLPLEFRRTGGFIGADDRVTVSADGIVTVERRGVTGSPFPLDAARLAKLRRLLAEPALAEPVARPTGRSVCNDGYVYRIRTPSWSVAADDCSRPGRPALDPVLQFLIAQLR